MINCSFAQPMIPFISRGTLEVSLDSITSKVYNFVYIETCNHLRRIIDEVAFEV